MFKWAEKNIPSIRPWFRTNLRHKPEAQSGQWLLGMCWINVFLSWGHTREHGESTIHWKHIGNVKKAAALDLLFLPLQVRIKLCLTGQPLGVRTIHLARKSHKSNEALEEKLGWSLCSTAIEAPLSSVPGVCALPAPGVPEMEKWSFPCLPVHQQLELLLWPRWLLIAAAGLVPQGTVIVSLNTCISQVMALYLSYRFISRETRALLGNACHSKSFTCSKWKLGNQKDKEIIQRVSEQVNGKCRKVRVWTLPLQGSKSFCNTWGTRERIRQGRVQCWAAFTNQ